MTIFLSLPSCRRSSLFTGLGGGGGKAYDHEIAWSSIKHSILSGIRECVFQLGADICSIFGLNATLSSMQEILTSQAWSESNYLVFTQPYAYARWFGRVRAHAHLYFSKIGRCAALSLSLIATLLLLSANSFMWLSCIYTKIRIILKFRKQSSLYRAPLKTAIKEYTLQLHTYRKKSHMKAHIRRNTAKWVCYLLDIPLPSFTDNSAP